MKTFNFIILAICAKDYVFDHQNGVLFREDDPISIHDASIPIDLNLLIDSPREKFRKSLNADCGETYLQEKMKTNFYGRNETIDQETQENCLLAFRTFDEIFLSFLGTDLVMTSAYNNSNYKQRSANLIKAGREALAQPSYEEWAKQGNKPKRSRRAAAVAAGLVVAGTGGYTVYVDAKSRARDALLAEEINLERERISKLDTVVETINSKLDEAVKRIKKSRRPIVSYGGLTIPDDAKAVRRILEGADPEINKYFAEQSASMGRELVESILTLTNHRLPLNPVFLDAVKAHCISYQSTVSEDQARQFCNSFAFHTSRWDTRLRFRGYGLTTWQRLDGKDLDKTNLEIRQVIISVRIEIPRMKLTARKFTAVNLGYFRDDGTRWKVDLPQHIVVMPSKETLEMRPSDCLKFTPSFSCASVSLAPNQCAESILLHNSTRYCQTQEIDNRKCGYFEDQHLAFVSMAQPGIAQWFHHSPSEKVMKIDSFKKTPFSGALNCGPQILRISAVIPEKEKTAESMIHFIQPQQIAMRTIQDDEIDAMNELIKTNLASVEEMGNTMLKMNMSTLEMMKTTAINESKNAAENTKNYLFKTFLAPIIGSIGTIAFILFSAIIIYIAIKMRSKRKKRAEQYALENFSRPKHSNRRNSLL